MRPDALFRFDTSFDVWEQINTLDSQGNIVVTYEFLRSELGMFITNPSGNFTLATRAGIPLNYQVRSVVDRNGNLAFSSEGEDFPMYVTASTAQFDAYGSIIGWRHTLSRNIPASIREILEA